METEGLKEKSSMKLLKAEELSPMITINMFFKMLSSLERRMYC